MARRRARARVRAPVRRPCSEAVSGQDRERSRVGGVGSEESHVGQPQIVPTFQDHAPRAGLVIQGGTENDAVVGAVEIVHAFRTGVGSRRFEQLAGLEAYEWSTEKR